MSSRKRTILIAGVATLALVAVAAFLVFPRVTVTTHESTAGAEFLDDYVTTTGRVTRRDQGGDTVSEGQAYAMLVAVAERDEPTFRQVWRWTRENIQRSDGLLAWHWVSGEVVDRSAAPDADLDAARALVLAGKRFSDSRLTSAGVRIGRAVLDHTTVRTPQGLVLVAGDWVDQPPWYFNPSYVSPVTTRILGRASGDPRWLQLEEGSRAAVMELTRLGDLPPDWALLEPDGSVRPAPSPGGESPRYGYDATRTLVRHAESCRVADQQIAAWAAPRLALHSTAYAVTGLDGSPMVEHSSPVALAGRAAAYARKGWPVRANADVLSGEALDRDFPSYYGAAWAALAHILLTDRSMGGCKPLEHR